MNEDFAKVKGAVAVAAAAAVVFLSVILAYNHATQISP